MNNRVHSQLVKTDVIVLEVDAVNREIVAQAADMQANIYVPPDCEVLLRGERVKLRMIQPQDRVRVTYRRRSEELIADTIEVQSAPAL